MNPSHPQRTTNADRLDVDSPGLDALSPAADSPGALDEYLKDDLDASTDDISDDSGHDGHSAAKKMLLREQDRFLPIANIAKIMKRAVPDTGKIAKDSRECIQECVSELISFITSEASERCQQEKRKTINGDDILYAMVALGFDHYAIPLTLYLHKYRESTKSERVQLVANTMALNKTPTTTAGPQPPAPKDR